ncbi:MAG: YciI family protein [Anaerolineae bacterium]|nr:YciI family protein [Anaerolineae bacterium]
MSSTQQWLYRIQPFRPQMLTDGGTPEEAAIVSEHFAYLQRLMEEGVLLLAGRTLNTDYSSFGIAVFNAESEEAAWELAHNDPAVKKKVMRAEIYPYRMALFDPENAV